MSSRAEALHKWSSSCRPKYATVVVVAVAAAVVVMIVVVDFLLKKTISLKGVYRRYIFFTLNLT
jgi:hypothetical protein